MEQMQSNNHPVKVNPDPAKTVREEKKQAEEQEDEEDTETDDNEEEDEESDEDESTSTNSEKVLQEAVSKIFSSNTKWKVEEVEELVSIKLKLDKLDVPSLKGKKKNVLKAFKEDYAIVESYALSGEEAT